MNRPNNDLLMHRHRWNWTDASYFHFVAPNLLAAWQSDSTLASPNHRQPWSATGGLIRGKGATTRPFA
uniref:hypothetical protein n=1 Tax=Paractinoplanes polyasparticus TaxID=2856853 RepID=UPI001C84558F|nr:hypothetical protein [Actinoplanes polyasparticus]